MGNDERLGSSNAVGGVKKQQSAGAERRARAARALRANLRRRKAQAFQRGDLSDSGQKNVLPPESSDTD
jgi:hypothetical protein